MESLIDALLAHLRAQTAYEKANRETTAWEKGDLLWEESKRVRETRKELEKELTEFVDSRIRMFLSGEKTE